MYLGAFFASNLLSRKRVSIAGERFVSKTGAVSHTDRCKANQVVHRHNDAVFHRAAVHYAARQIEQLFWYSSEPDDLLEGERDFSDDIVQGLPGVGDDLADPK